MWITVLVILSIGCALLSLAFWRASNAYNFTSALEALSAFEQQHEELHSRVMHVTPGTFRSVLKDLNSHEREGQRLGVEMWSTRVMRQRLSSKYKSFKES